MALPTVILLLYEVILESMFVVRKTKNGLCTLYNGGYLVARQCMINMRKDDGGIILHKKGMPHLWTAFEKQECVLLAFHIHTLYSKFAERLMLIKKIS